MPTIVSFAVCLPKMPYMPLWQAKPILLSGTGPTNLRCCLFPLLFRSVKRLILMASCGGMYSKLQGSRLICKVQACLIPEIVCGYIKFNFKIIATNSRIIKHLKKLNNIFYLPTLLKKEGKLGQYVMPCYCPF